MKLSGILAATLTSVVALSSANAADMYRAPEGVSYKDTPYVAVNWAGFYAGVNGGYGWTASGDTSFLQPSGGFGGGQIGYNWQGVWHPHLVLGIEADIQGADISDSKIGITSQANYFGTVRGRIGYAFDRALVYATGGFAYGEIEDKALGASVSKTETGYVVGGGIEYKINPSWSVKGEYQYINLDSGNTNSFLTVSNNGDFHSDFHTVRAGINYHFGNEIAPLK